MRKKGSLGLFCRCCAEMGATKWCFFRKIGRTLWTFEENAQGGNNWAKRQPNKRKVSRRVQICSQRERSGAQREPKVSRKGAKRNATGAKRRPKGSKREPDGGEKATQTHPKIYFQKRLRKVWILGAPGYYRIVHFGSHFPSKIDEQIDAKIDAKKVMKNHEKRCKNDAILDWKSSKKWSCAKSA